jgi:hypothetical protein
LGGHPDGQFLVFSVLVSAQQRAAGKHRLGVGVKLCQLQVMLHAGRQGQAARADNHRRARHSLEPIDALAQVGGRTGGIVVGPEQRGQSLACLRPVQGQSGQEGSVARRQRL